MCNNLGRMSVVLDTTVAEHCQQYVIRVCIGNSRGFRGSHRNPIGMGIAKLISWEWEWLDGNGRE